MKKPQLANAFKLHFQNPMFFLLPDEDEFKNIIPLQSKVKIKMGNIFVWCLVIAIDNKYPNQRIMAMPEKSNANFIHTKEIELHNCNILDIETPGYEFTQRNGAEMLKEVKKTSLFFFYLKPLKKSLADMRLRHPVTLAGKIVIGLRLFGWKIF